MSIDAVEWDNVYESIREVCRTDIVVIDDTEGDATDIQGAMQFVPKTARLLVENRRLRRALSYARKQRSYWKAAAANAKKKKKEEKTVAHCAEQCGGN